MRNTLFFVVAAILLMYSCQKEAVLEQQESQPIVFTASIDATRTSVDCATGKVSWEEYDEITISNGVVSKVYVTYEGGASATFHCSEASLPAFSEAGSYSATYGSAPVAGVVQEYSASPGKRIYMEAESTSTANFTFSVKCGLLKLHLYHNPSRPVSRIFVSDGNNTFTLACDIDSSGVRIHEGRDFYIALPEGTYTSYVVRDGMGYEAIKTVKSGKTGTVIRTNEISQVSFSNLSFDAPVYPESGTAAIRIDNIWWAPVNCGYSSTDTLGLLYQWGRKYGQSASAAVAPEFTNTPAESMAEGSAIENKDKFYLKSGCWFSPCYTTDTWESGYNPCPEGWRVSLESDFNNLINNIVDVERNWYAGKDITGTKAGACSGYLFKYTLEEDGNKTDFKLFLPAVGYRSYLDGALSNQMSVGGYWLSEPSASIAEKAKFCYFSSAFSPEIKEDCRTYGRSVRCVRE